MIEMTSITTLRAELRKAANPAKVTVYKNFHKTSTEGYAYGEEFLGVTVPTIRKIALANLDLSLGDLFILLSSKIHEEKYLAAEMLVGKYYASSNKKAIFDLYIEHASGFSGWDLVDTSAPHIVGHFLYSFGKEYPIYKILLSQLAHSSNLWERRIAIVSTYHFIKNKQFDETLRVATILLTDKHDLIQKAVGWMLREVGKRDDHVLKTFLNQHYKVMPRTMLRYALERLSASERTVYMKRDT